MVQLPEDTISARVKNPCCVHVSWYLSDSTLKSEQEKIEDKKAVTKNILRIHNINENSNYHVTDVNFPSGSYDADVKPGRQYGFELGLLCESDRTTQGQDLSDRVTDEKSKTFICILASRVVEVPETPYQRHHRALVCSRFPLRYRNPLQRRLEKTT
ncbi:DUF4912 domain-containing protein [Candidatus Woesearchaeota archaeon]|nr:DUF4912 domain-containing protein [Candidatus Woesearchaeota archaeon]